MYASRASAKPKSVNFFLKYKKWPSLNAFFECEQNEPNIINGQLFNVKSKVTRECVFH